MVDKINSWKFVEEFNNESAALHKARIRAEELGVESITPSVGAALSLITASLGAKAIVEVGTGAGVSALWLLGSNDSVVLATIDPEPEHQAAARLAFADAGIAPNRTRVIAGKGDEVMSNMADAAYDLVFLDGDRETLPQQVREATRLVRPGGVIAVSHALWRDRVPDPAIRDEATSTYREVINFFTAHDDYIVSLLPIGDGLLLACRK